MAHSRQTDALSKQLISKPYQLLGQSSNLYLHQGFLSVQLSVRCHQQRDGPAKLYSRVNLNFLSTEDGSWSLQAGANPVCLCSGRDSSREAELDNPDVWHMSLHIPQKHQHLLLHVPHSWPRASCFAGALQAP